MPDREKVIKAIEACIDHDHPPCCKECYLDGPGFGIACREKLMRGALALLREQEPVEPHWRCPTVYMNGTGKIELMCGNCGISIPLGKPIYCPWCGREVKWDDAE